MYEINNCFLEEKNKKALWHKLLFSLCVTPKQRECYLRKHKILAGMGSHIHWQPRKFPTDPYCLYLHNNIAIAANVTFLGHDIINYVLNGMQEEKIYGHKGCIEIMDNVFIGANVTICPNFKIGPNAIVAAGSVVVKDVKEGTIVGGNPAKVIGSFDDLMKRRIDENKIISGMTKTQRIELSWKQFKESREGYK